MSKPLAAVDRPLALRVRADLAAVPVEMAGATTWIVKDPLTLEHFQFTVEEYALIERLRRPASIADLQRTFARGFPPQTISPHAMWDFLSRLHSAGLLISDGEGQGCELIAQMRRDRWRRWGFAWTQILAMRFRGVNPDAFLTAAHEHLRWLFSPVALAAVVAVLLYAASIVVGHFHEFVARLPELSALADVRNVIWLLLAIGGVKVLHELGHALAAKHYGGEVHELGFMLLAFSPCLYCDVTDAWRLPSKWKRIAVSAAGMAVELVLAALAIIVWWYSQPGVVNLLALNVILVCTVGTLLVNGNPLLKFDGYYILSDLVETPNLWQRSRDVLREGVGSLLRLVSLVEGRSLQSQKTPDPLVPRGQRVWLAAYGLASKTYVALVCVAIVWALVVLLYPLHLQNVAYAVGLTVLAGALVGPVTGAARLLHNPIRRSELRIGRLAVAAAVGLAALVALLAMPVNYYVYAPLVVMPDEAARVYATVDGTLHDAPESGRHVAQGDVIAELHNAQIELELRRLEGDYQLQQLRLEHLERLRGVDAAANDQIPAARAALADLERRLDDRRGDAERLRLVAPADGVVIPAPRVGGRETFAIGGRDATSKATSRKRLPTPSRLPRWSGSILDAANRGSHVEPGTLVCFIGDPARLNALLLVDDTDAKRLRPGQAVRMRLDQLPARVIDGAVVEVARHEMHGAAGDAASRPDLAPLLAGIVPTGHNPTRYQVHVAFDSAEHPLVIGGRGTAKVAAERITLARWMVRLLGKTFRLPM